MGSCPKRKFYLRVQLCTRSLGLGGTPQCFFYAFSTCNTICLSMLNVPLEQKKGRQTCYFFPFSPEHHISYILPVWWHDELTGTLKGCCSSRSFFEEHFLIFLNACYITEWVTVGGPFMSSKPKKEQKKNAAILLICLPTSLPCVIGKFIRLLCRTNP